MSDLSRSGVAISNGLDPVTFEVLKNAFVNIVDQMAEQILRTCYSFVIYSRDFSSALCDAQGNTVMQGSQDISVHVGTLHLTAQAVLNHFKDDIHPGDVFIVNDPYLGGTHFSDVRIVRPVFCEGSLIALTQSNGHWADVGGSVPGSFDIRAKEHFGEGLRIPPLRIWSRGQYQSDVANMLVANMRVPSERLGDLRAQAEATRVAEIQLLALIDKYGKNTVLAAFEECQNYVERMTRAKVLELPNGSWESVDYIDQDPDFGEGLIPVHVHMRIQDGQILYDLSGSHKYIGCFLNSPFGASLSAVVSGTKTFFPEVPLNSGFYRVLDIKLPDDSVVNAPWPVAVTGFCSGAYEKIMNAIHEIWSQIMPERAIACSFNLEYLLVGGWDVRHGSKNYFMWYDWMAGGHGGRNGKDGANATSPLFGVGLSIQPCEGQERLSPVITTRHEILVDSGGPGKWRGGCGVVKGGRLTRAEGTVMSYSCDRSRSVTWGINGGLPSMPHGVTLTDSETDVYLGSIFSNVSIEEDNVFTRPSAGGGGFGDPLERDPRHVVEDVIDGYVSIERAEKDYGVVVREVDAELCEFEFDSVATIQCRENIRQNRRDWLGEDGSAVRDKYLNGQIDQLDVIRRYGVILDWDTGELLERTTEEFRNMMRKRADNFW